MRTLIAALAAGLCLAAMTISASAQGPSYETRGYGGPLYVGPNFQQGGQHAPPVYGQVRSKSERAATRRGAQREDPQGTVNARGQDRETVDAKGRKRRCVEFHERREGRQRELDHLECHLA